MYVDPSVPERPFFEREMMKKTALEILIVDDSRVIQIILSKQLGRLGYYCDTADNGIEALQKIEDGNYDLILLDINMPHISGIEVLRRLKEKRDHPPVVMVSSVDAMEPVRMTFQAGAFDYVTKPWNLEALQFTVVRAIEHGQLLRENREHYNHLEKNVQERTQELTTALGEIRRTYQETILALGSALETRDTETQAHSLRVACYATLLASELGINDTDQMIDIERGAFLHDIGKIGVPDHILKKPESLSPGEWEVMKKHPEIGKKLIEGIAFLKGATKTVYCHHERYDGSGYPQGLRGENIPIEARIFAVVDAFDALTSERPYRNAIPIPETIERIQANSGTQFDPGVMQAFVEIAESTLSSATKRSDG